MVTRLIALLVVATVATNPPDDAVNKEIANLQGTWLCVSVEGEDNISEKEAKSITLVIRANKTLTMTSSKQKEEGTYTLHPERTPKVIKMVTASEKTPITAIYLLHGDTLKLCQCTGTDPNELPKEFAAGPTQVLGTFKRKK